jgi:2-polyprenyl-3-methyl-5-hydroxy-6-metoxy-1,4-benzoquinol methylase
MVPAHLSRNFRPHDQSLLDMLRAPLISTYPPYTPEQLASKWFCDDLQSHLTGRLENDRLNTVPWLDSVGRLSGARILEVGCGTGCSTLALAEQGAMVTSIDIDGPSMEVARLRCKLYGVNAEIRFANATEISTLFAGRKFDFIIFYASLEHMTHHERLTALAAAWKILEPNALLCVIETPNRLWFQDGHTSLMEFYHWLPDELAFEYSRFSSRASFRDAYREFNEANFTDFLRRGRGASYHEFHLALGIAPKDLNVVSSLSAFKRQCAGLPPYPPSPSGLTEAYQFLLSVIAPHVPRPFFDENLDLIIRKPT